MFLGVFVLSLLISVDAVRPSLPLRGGDVPLQTQASSSVRQGAAANNHRRKLLACAVVDSPTFKVPDGSGAVLPLCSTQRINTGSGWATVTPRAAVALFSSLSVTAADLAHAWVQDPVNPRTDSTLQCSGQIDTTAKHRCWGGNGPYIDTIFTSLSCCGTQVSCSVKSGGCVA